jgi:circadian clock protein KaiB
MRKEPIRSQKKYTLRLFVAGATTRSMLAIQNVRQLCEGPLADHYQLEIIDVYQQPALARAEQIVATPTLLKQEPLPVRRFIGDLSNTTRIIMGLGAEKS